MSEIDPHTRQRIERQRLMRVVRETARAPTPLELERLGALMRKVEPALGAGEYFAGMQAKGLTHANRGDLDVRGFGSLKADGVHAHLARVTTRSAASERERYDTVLCVLRNNEVLAFDHVVLLKPTAQLVLDGELCLRKETLSEAERYRINSAVSVHTGDYLEFHTAADEEAAASGTDVRAPAHQRQYDAHYTLLFGAFDVLYAGARVTSNTYLERMKIAKELTETPLARQTSIAFKRAEEELRAQIEYAGGFQALSLFVFTKPIWPVQFIKAALHTVPECMRGVLVDGVIFNPSDEPYRRGVNPRLLKFKVAHPVDFDIAPVRAGGEHHYALRLLSRGRLIEVEGAELRCDTRLATELLDEMFGGGRASAIVECELVNGGDGGGGGILAWRPLQHRAEKQRPNSYEAYQDTFGTLKHTLDESALIRYVRERLRVGVSGPGAGGRQ